MPRSILRQIAHLPTNTKLQRRPRGRPTSREAGTMQAQLVAIALRHFTMFGFDAASIEAIAREAGVTRQGIYQRFGSKKDFFDAVMRQREEQFYADLTLSPTADPADPTEVLFDYAWRTVCHLHSPDRIALSRAMAAGLHRFPEIASLQQDSFDRATSRICAYLETALRHDGIARTDCRDAAEDLRSLLNGLATPVVLGLATIPGPGERAARIGGLLQRFMRGIGLQPDDDLIRQRIANAKDE